MLLVGGDEDDPRRLAEPAGPVSATRCPTVMAPTGVYAAGTSNAARNATVRSDGMPKKHAPRPSSTAVCRISSEAIPVSTCQYGTGQRASSRSVQPLSGWA